MKPKSSRQLAVVFFLAMIAAATAHASETTTYSYDPLGRLSGASSTAGPQVATTYDPAGNRTIYDVTGVVTKFSISDASTVEGGIVTFTVTKTNNASGSLSVNYATGNGSAVAGSDFGTASGTLTFLATETSKTVSVATIDDSLVEGPETFTVGLSGPTGGAVLGVASATGTINDNDSAPLPSFAISNAATVTEGGILQFSVTKTGSTASSFSVTYATADGSAAAGSDYTAISGTLTFTSAETVKTINVATIDDTAVESAETVLANLSAPTGGSTVTTSQGSGIINDNDVAPPPPPSFAISNAAAVAEGGVLQFSVTKTGSTTSSFSVNYATANGSAAAGSDYTAASGTLTFGSAETVKVISVSTIDDSAVESAETVLANLSAPTGGATITTAQGSGTINDNDVPPSNQPPTPVNDFATQQKCSVDQYNVVYNDTDPDGDYPLTLVSVTGGGFSVVSSTDIQVVSGATATTKVGTYTVRDSRGATATATLSVTISGVCQ